MCIDPRLHRIVASQAYPLLFASISGAHLYGFPSPDSDFDLRGAHILPLENVVGLTSGDETEEDSRVIEGLEMDIVTHDVRKFFGLLLKKNGYVLEQLLSPLVVHTTPEHEELKVIALGLEGCTGVVTQNHAHHYLGFSDTQWRMFTSQSPHRVKTLLYVYRVLLTGIHLMQTGVLEPNLPKLNEVFKLPYLPELIAKKIEGPEKAGVPDLELAVHEAEFRRLTALLETARNESWLPEAPCDRTKSALNDLLVRIRLAHCGMGEIPSRK